MDVTPYSPTGEYQPESTPGLLALYAWPPRLFAALQSKQEGIRKQRRQST